MVTRIERYLGMIERTEKDMKKPLILVVICQRLYGKDDT